MKQLFFLFIILCSSAFYASGQGNHDISTLSLRSGDLLFCGATSSALSKAIDESTQTRSNTHFDHMGIVEFSHDSCFVMHAAPQKGVCSEPIALFLASDSIKREVVAYRLKDKFNKSIPTALRIAHQKIGANYNYSYRMNSTGYYCSEFIYELFAADSVFTLNPMTFKDPSTGQFLPGWIDHYAKLGIPIPEGEAGCNPNGLAASEKLELVGVVRNRADE